MDTPTNNGATQFVFEVRGEAPDAGYELCVRFDLPWKRCAWRGESGGAFNTPGPTEKGGDSLLGIAGSIFSVGEGLSATSKRADRRIDFAFDESGYCGLGRRTTLFARGMYDDAPDTRLMQECLMRGIETEATLFWYLLSNQQNRREALLDQAGARHWRFRCGVRMVTGAFDDVDLYRFAAGFNRTAELIDADRAHFGNDWLSSTSNSILVLGCRRRGDGVEVDLYNTRQRLCHTTLNGTLVRNATLTRTDMLGFNPKRVKDRAIALAPLEFAKITVKSR